jgi:hypothetical protein
MNLWWASDTVLHFWTPLLAMLWSFSLQVCNSISLHFPLSSAW